jgi:hypothetical protein
MSLKELYPREGGRRAMINKEVPVAIRRIDAALMAGTPAVMGRWTPTNCGSGIFSGLLEIEDAVAKAREI